MKTIKQRIKEINQKAIDGKLQNLEADDKIYSLHLRKYRPQFRRSFEFLFSYLKEHMDKKNKLLFAQGDMDSIDDNLWSKMIDGFDVNVEDGKKTQHIKNYVAFQALDKKMRGAK